MNLIITCPRHFEEDTVREVETIFERFGYKEPEIIITSMPGILTVNMNEDPVEFAKKVKEKVKDEPWTVRYSKRIIPVQRSTVSEISEIVKCIPDMCHIMKDDETYRITVEKRHSDISSKQIITEIARVIPNKVSLDTSDWMVLVEILGSEAGVSVIKPEEIVSIEKTKRSISEQD